MLLAARTSRALADQNALGLAPRQFQHLVRDKIVEQDHVSRLQRADGLQGQQFCVAWSGADEGDVAAGGSVAA